MESRSTTSIGGSEMSKWVPVLIIFGAMVLRLVLAFINQEANDNHVDVVNLIVSTNKLPQKADCWSCYQPKLFYIICASVVKIFNVTGDAHRIKAMQLVNVFFSFFVLLIFRRFIWKQQLSDESKNLVLAFFAFNPCLVGINVQSTNDTQAIFFGVLAVYICNQVFINMKATWLFALVVALIGALLTKASAIVLTAAISLAFMVKIFLANRIEEKIKAAKYLVILLIAILTIAPLAGGYYNNYRQYHSLTISCWEKDPAPYFFEKTFIVRAGLRSMFEGFFSFRYFGMIWQPYINNDWNNYPMHRTSLWSQLYGRTVFMHFDQWPMGWQSHSDFIINVGRLLIALGIVPLGLFLAGVFFNIQNLIYRFVKKDRGYLSSTTDYLFVIVALAFLASSIFYSYTYRDFSSMKSIYIFPAMLAFLKLFIDGFSSLKTPKANLVIKVSLSMMVVLSVADIVFLIQQLC